MFVRLTLMDGKVTRLHLPHILEVREVREGANGTVLRAAVKMRTGEWLQVQETPETVERLANDASKPKIL